MKRHLSQSFRQMLLPATVIVGLFSIIPMAGMILLSFTDYNLIKGFRGEVGIHNYFKVFSDRRFINSIEVSAWLSLLGVSIQLILGTMIAVGLDKIVKSWRLARGLFILPFAVPHVAVALIWLSLFTPTLSPLTAFFTLFGVEVPSLLTSKFGAIFAIVIADSWASFPFVTLIVLAALQGIPSEIDEAAAMDGATRVKTFFVITLPLLYPTFLVIALFRFIETLKHFPLIFILTSGGPGRSTQATNYYAYIQSFQNSNIAYGSTIAVILFIFAAVVSFYVAKLNTGISNG